MFLSSSYMPKTLSRRETAAVVISVRARAWGGNSYKPLGWGGKASVEGPMQSFLTSPDSPKQMHIYLTRAGWGFTLPMFMSELVAYVSTVFRWPLNLQL